MQNLHFIYQTVKICDSCYGTLKSTLVTLNVQEMTTLKSNNEEAEIDEETPASSPEHLPAKAASMFQKVKEG
jgi:hypothetical protein